MELFAPTKMHNFSLIIKDNILLTIKKNLNRRYYFLCTDGIMEPDCNSNLFYYQQ